MLSLFRRYTLLLLVSATLGCASVSTGPGVADTLPPGILRIHELRSSVVWLTHDGGNRDGSGVALLRYDGKTYFGTAKHVAEHVGLGGVFDIQWWDSARKTGTARVLLIHPTEDVAVLVSEDSEVPTVAYDDSEKPAGTLVATVGCPGGAFPPMVGFGSLVNGHRGMYSGDAQGWFGNSGGGLFDYETAKCIGITVHLHGDGEGAFSNRLCSVPISILVKLGRESFGR